MSILEKKINSQKEDESIESVDLNCCDDGVLSYSLGNSVNIEFPRGATKLPLAGGAVISIDASNLKITSSKNISSILSKDLSPLSGLNLENKIQDLNRARLAINKALYNIALKDIKVIDEGDAGGCSKKKAPFVYLSILDSNSSDIELVDGVSNPDIVRTCRFRYIPPEVFSGMLNNLLDNSSGVFTNTVGLSGRTFSDLKDVSDKVLEAINSSSSEQSQGFLDKGGDDADIIDLILEFFPVVNISENSLLSLNNTPTIGGYYTIIDGTIYIKLPDLSGRDSSGNLNGIIEQDYKLFIEVEYNSTLTRINIEDFAVQPSATIVGDSELEFPIKKDLDVIIDTNGVEPQSIYLSPIVKNISIKKEKNTLAYSDNIELFSVPLLTAPIQDGASRVPMLHEGSSPSIYDINNYIVSSGSKIDAYVGEFSKGYIDLEVTGHPFLGSKSEGSSSVKILDPYVFFGEKNRPEIILSKNKEAIDSNDKKYYSLSSYGALSILASCMPKIYNNLPSKWIKSNTPKSNGDGTYTVTFNRQDFANIDLSNDELSGSIEYAVYISDNYGQISRVFGSNIKLLQAVPVLDNIGPNGFSGTQPIIIDSASKISILGDNLAGVSNVQFSNQQGAVYKIFVNSSDGIIKSPTNTELNINFAESDMSLVGLSSGIWSVKLVGLDENYSSQEKYIYISSELDEELPEEERGLAKFIGEDVKSINFSDNVIYGIPLLRDGSDANIAIKSKSGLFSSNKDIYAYIGFPNNDANASIISSFSSSSNRLVVYSERSESNILIPTEIEYVFSKTISGDFYRDGLFRKRAYISFPGDNYRAYNFSDLINIRKAYIIFSNKKLNPSKSEIVELSSEDHDILTLGTDDTPAFIEPSSVLGIAIESGGRVSATFSEDTFPIPDGLFSSKINVETLRAYNKISKMAVIVSGTEQKFLKNRYDIKIGGQSLIKKKNLADRPKNISKDKILFVFENVVPPSDGILDITVDRKDFDFGVSYSNESYIAQATFAIKASANSLFTIDEDTGSLTINSSILPSSPYQYIDDFNNSDDSYGLIGSALNPLDVMLPNIRELGILFDRSAPDIASTYRTFSPVDITANTKMLLNLNDEDVTLLANKAASSIYSLSRLVLGIDSGAVFSNANYIKNLDDDVILLFTNLIINKFPSIKYRVPEVISITKQGSDEVLLSSNNQISLISGIKYDVIVENTDRDFVIKFDETVVNPRYIPEKNGTKPGRYKAVIEVPESLVLSSQECYAISASTSNSERVKAKKELGRTFVGKIDTAYQHLLDGPLKDSIPNISEQVERVANAPLRFVQVLLSRANIPKNLVNSFCDYSFHLSSELKVSLNGFRVFLVPVQVIFCIIDVICSLINPFRLAKAIIRLFQCLYDLILIIPQISVPVMCFQLVLHLLELISCITERIALTMTSINEIIKAINKFSEPPINYSSLKSLEERLSEYLYEIEADLQILTPIVSIFDIFLDLLQMVFRFPCTINPEDGQSDCGIDGTLLAGIISGIVAPDGETIDSGALLPVGQTYSNDEELGSTSDVTEPTSGYIIGSASDDDSILNSMDIDEDTLRGVNAGNGTVDFNATMAPSYTKGSKAPGKPKQIKFKFNGRGEDTALTSKNIDPNQTIDTPIYLLNKNGSKLELIENGNIYSPIDGAEFLDVNSEDGTASVKPLVLDLEVPVFTTDPNTGLQIQSGTQTITRTFDNIPMMAIMDDQFNVYFIQDDGIKYNKDGLVDQINANIINMPSATKIKFSREEVEIDTDGDGDVDGDDSGDTIKIFDFPQLYFVDMRQAAEQIEQFCSTASINNFPFQDNNLEDIIDIVEDGSDCVNEYISSITNQISSLRSAQQLGELPLSELDIEELRNSSSKAEECLDSVSSNICKYVINGLNTSFKVLDDLDETPLEEYSDGTVSDVVLDGFDADGPAFTGAREYAAGIGDSASVFVGDIASIEVIPRDAFDNEIVGDLSDKIQLEIVYDSTGSAEFIKNDEQSIFSKNQYSYTANITAKSIGEVRLKARVCDRTIQAITYDGIDSSSTSIDEQGGTDCVPDAGTSSDTQITPIGALIKVDRLISIFFVQGGDGSVKLVSKKDDYNNSSPVTEPQVFGSKLVN